ncbi:MAG: T9SS type A sorting domain-containing protein [Bacteroidetes bacterium]|nr:T9SS type A sorting domain-containing protein [Bacteroidota bacterium]
MKFTFLTFFAILFSASFAQNGIIIKIEGGSDDISGLTHTMTAPGSTVFDVPFIIENQTGQSHQWVVTRYKINVPTGWADGLCWGHSTDPFGGTCYSSSQMSANPWTSSTNPNLLFTIDNGEYGKMKPQINPADDASGQAHYRYYISDPGSGYSDSVDLIIDYTASLKPVKDEVSVSIVPNPASDYISISTNGFENASLKIIDILGNTVYKDVISGTKTILTSNYKTGVYFVTIDQPGMKPVSRKIVIRH